ncbi:MAG: hypothetical protein EU532_01735 [Promethearchaeota archaeon]|nr:MAG: hypothetical protein EU532_01735 [Candidatus Lokiarchaeota archaeon]
MGIKSQKVVNSKDIYNPRQIMTRYIQEMSQTFEFLKDSKDYLEYKRMAKKISGTIYLVRFSSLMNMAVVYFYSLYEAFTRNFFGALLLRDNNISYQEYKIRYPRFHDVLEKVVRGIYDIFLPKHIYETINHLRIARNQIIHLGKNAKPSFDIIETCYDSLTEYFEFLDKKMPSQV